MIETLREKKAAKAFDSLPEMLLHRLLESPQDEAFSYPDANEVWQKLTWSDVEVRVRRIAGGLRALGIGLEDRVAILSLTRIEWILADLGTLCAGGATTTIYPSNTPEECEFILTDSGTRLVFAEDDDQIAKLQEIREKIPTSSRS